MEINSYCIENNYYCIRFEKDCYFVEDLSTTSVLSLHHSHLTWFEKHLVDLLQGPVQAYFFKQERDEMGTCRSASSDPTWSALFGLLLGEGREVGTKVAG